MVKGREDANKHILILEPPSLLEPDAFLATVKVNAVSGGFLFVHGYNTSLEGGLRRTAQLATDLDVKGPVFHYAWPSAANPLRYDYDGESVKVSSEPFKRFVKLLLEECGLEALNVVAHSKGNELVLDAFFDLAQSSNGSRGAQHLILASPDVDRSFGQQRLTSVPSYFASVTLYANKYDRPLLLSAGKAGGPRLGGMMGDRHPFIAKDVDSIDAANTDFGWFGLNHDAYVDAPVLMFDVKALLERGVRPPDIRNPVIRPKTCKRGTYYKVVTE